MSAVPDNLIETIKALQALPSLASFALGGGTNLAIRYNHRESDDIDLFCPDIIGRKGFEAIASEVAALYKDKAFGFQYPCEIDDQFIFLRFFVYVEKDNAIKVEVLQNMKLIDQIETEDDLRLVSKRDIGLFKLVSASNRASKKDIYDLDFITNEFPIVSLYNALAEKQASFNHPADRNIFDLDGESSPIGKPELLLKFDDGNGYGAMPGHSNDNIRVHDGSETWAMAKVNWRMKVRELYRHLGKPFPGAEARRP